MHDERLAATDTPAPTGQDKADIRIQTPGLPAVRDRYTRHVVLGLTGLLGVAWAMVVAIRYTEVIPH